VNMNIPAEKDRTDKITT